MSYLDIFPRRDIRGCGHRFETIQGVHEKPLAVCPDCGVTVRKIISWCRAAIVEGSNEHTDTEQKIAAYEKEGMWSHAAELADKHSEKLKDKGIQERALDNYKKAGYNVDSLEKHAKTINEW